MKVNVFKTIAASLMGALILASCEPTVPTCSGLIGINITGLDGVPAPDSYTITITNVGTTEVTTIESPSPLISVMDLAPGTYDITVKAVTSKGGSAYILTGSASSVVFTGGDFGSIYVDLTAVKSSALIMKEIHYNATKTLPNEQGKTSTYLKDTFFELYNNGDETVYLDGVCLGNALSSTTFDFSAQQDKLSHPVSEYVFMETYVWRIPGSGKQYPLAPGESAIISASAIDHSLVANAPSHVTAEFETICQKYIDKGQTDASAINMELACTIKETGLANQFGNFTGEAWVLFYPSEPLRADGQYLESNKANNYGQEVLIADVLDAVDLKKNAAAEKQLVEALDMGAIWCATTGGNQSIVRKVSGEKDGRKIYQDTNNTTDDFEVVEGPELRRNGAKRPSWSTWTTAQ